MKNVVKCIALSLSLLTVSVFGSMALAKSSGKRIEVHGHRGARAILPENSLSAFSKALEIGVDVIELDIVVSKDDVLIVNHDLVINPELCRLKGKKVGSELALRGLTSEQIKQFDCGSLKNKSFPRQKTKPGEQIPTLEEVIQLVKSSKAPAAKNVRLNIEAKGIPGHPELTPPISDYAKLIVAALEKHEFLSRSIIQSFDHRILRTIKKLRPRLKIAALFSANLPDLVSAAKELKADIVSPHHLWITQQEVVSLHEYGVEVVPWTVNEPKGWQRLIDFDVDGIITDDPESLLDYLSRQNRR